MVLVEQEKSAHLHACGNGPDGVGEEDVATAGDKGNQQGWPHTNVLLTNDMA